MHSGTFLLVDILRRNPSVFTPDGETKFFDFLPSIRRAYPDLADDKTYRRYILFLCRVVQNGLDPNLIAQENGPTLRGLETRDIEQMMARAPRSHVQLFPVVFDTYARIAGKIRWLEKTPSHIYHADEILSVVPNARIVEIVRDPRAVLASKKVRRQSVWTERYKEDRRLHKHFEKAFNPVWDSLSWKSAVRAGYQGKARHANQWLTVSYEELVADQEGQVMQVCEFLQLPYDTLMLEVTLHNSAYWGNTPAKGISAEYVAKWRKVLTPGELRVIQLLLRREITAAGYQLETVRGGRARAVVIMLESIPEFLQRLYHRYKLYGASYLWTIIAGYWHRLVKLLDAGNA